MILILGGTTEAYKKAQELDHRNIPFIVTVATDYGFRSFSEYFKEKAVLIDFTQESLTRFIREKGITQVYDCTHPYAFIITERAQKVCNTLGIVYKTFKRDIESTYHTEYENIITVKGFHEAAEHIKKSGRKRILLTIGSKNLMNFKEIRDREVFARVLPDVQSIKQCLEAGMRQQNIIAAQGPFTVDFNRALIKLHDICCLVTKRSGKAGGFYEKIEACRQTGIEIVVVEKEQSVDFIIT